MIYQGRPADTTGNSTQPGHPGMVAWSAQDKLNIYLHF